MKGLLLTCLLCLSISWLEAQEMTVKRERVLPEPDCMVI